MSPRPRSVENEEILAAVGRVIGRVGPAKLTLSLIAKEVGLSPATLVQRFGSKRGLLLALGKESRSDDSAFLEKLREKCGSPLSTAREFLLCFSRMAGTPDELANHLAAFQMDLVEPDLREVALKVANEQEATIRKLLEEAAERGEIQRCSPKRLAPVLLAVAQGSLLSWALYRRGSARAWMARHIDTALGPHLPES